MVTSTVRTAAVVTVAATILSPPVLAQGIETGADAAAGNQANGRALFAGIGCGSCHGAEGHGTAAAPSIATGALPLPEFIAYTRRPTGTMPPYSTQLVPDQGLIDMYAYLGPPVAQPAPAGRADVGATLYRQTGCYACHADEAQGGTQGPRIGPDPGTFSRFSWYHRHPTGAMPPYTATVLSDQDLADIYAFLQTRPQPPPVSSIPLLAP